MSNTGSSRTARLGNDPALSAELDRLVREQAQDARRAAAGRLGAVALSADLDDVGLVEHRTATPHAGDDGDDYHGDDDDLTLQPVPGGPTSSTPTSLDDGGTAGDGRRHRIRSLLRCHIERLTIIDPVTATIAAARWLYERPLTVPQIVELTGRATSTITANLRATYLRLMLLDLLPPPNPATTYVPARAAGLSRGAAGFAFWLGFTLSPERAAELSGYGKTGPTSARNYVLGKLKAASASNLPLLVWSESLIDAIDRLNSIRAQANAKLVSTLLGKRRSNLHPEIDASEKPKLVPWLDEIDLASPDVDFDPAEMEQRALRRYAQFDGDPVALLADTLERAPNNIVTVGLELAARELPYADTFRDA